MYQYNRKILLFSRSWSRSFRDIQQLFSCFRKTAASIRHHEESLNAEVICFGLKKTHTWCTLSCGILSVRSHFVIENQTLSKDVWCTVHSVRWIQEHNKIYDSAITVIETSTQALCWIKTTATVGQIDGRSCRKNLIPMSTVNYSITEFQQN